MKHILVVALVFVTLVGSAEAQVGWRIPTGPQSPLSDNLNGTLAMTCPGIWIDSVTCVPILRRNDTYFGLNQNRSMFPVADLLGRPIGPVGSSVIGALIGGGAGYAYGGNSRWAIAGMSAGSILGLIVDRATKEGEYDRFEKTMRAFARAGGQYPQARVQPAVNQQQPALPPPASDIYAVSQAVPPMPPQPPTPPMLKEKILRSDLNQPVRFYIGDGADPILELGHSGQDKRVVPDNEPIWAEVKAMRNTAHGPTEYWFTLKPGRGLCEIGYGAGWKAISPDANGHWTCY